MPEKTYTKRAVFRLTDAALLELDDLAKQLGVTRSEALRRAIMMAHRELDQDYKGGAI